MPGVDSSGWRWDADWFGVVLRQGPGEADRSDGEPHRSRAERQFVSARVSPATVASSM